MSILVVALDWMPGDYWALLMYSLCFNIFNNLVFLIIARLALVKSPGYKMVLIKLCTGVKLFTRSKVLWVSRFQRWWDCKFQNKAQSNFVTQEIP